MRHARRTVEATVAVGLGGIVIALAGASLASAAPGTHALQPRLLGIRSGIVKMVETGAFAVAEAEKTKLAVAVDAFVRPYADSGSFSGSVLIASGGEVLVDEAYGSASLGLTVANTPRTRYQIGSISKTFTAAAILLLEERGALRLDDPLAKFLPSFPNGAAITIRHLLAHTSGLPRYVLQPDYPERSRRHHTPSDLVAWVAELPPAAPPGQRAAYSNANYAVLAAIIEKVSGREFGQFLDVEVLRPLGLRDTGHARDAQQVVEHLASGYHPVGRSGFEKARAFDYTSLTGAGSLYSTTHDLLRWYRALRRGDLLGKSSLALLFSREKAADTFAWKVTDHGGRPAVSAQGWDGVGFSGKLLHLEGEDVTVVVLGNLNISSVSSELVDGLADIALGKEHEALQLATTPADPAVVRKLAGVYRFGPDFYVPDTTIELVESDGELLVGGAQPGALLRISDTEFIHRQHWVRITFRHDEHGGVTGMAYGRFEAKRETPSSPGGTPPQETLVIRDVTIIDGTGAGPASGMAVVVEGGRIRAIGPNGSVEPPRSARVIAAGGRYLIPGLYYCSRPEPTRAQSEG